MIAAQAEEDRRRGQTATADRGPNPQLSSSLSQYR